MTSMENSNEYKLVPTFGNSFGTGWKVMSDNFLRLLLVVFVLLLITAPFKLFNLDFDMGDFKSIPLHWTDDFTKIFSLASLGIFAAFMGLIALLYAFLAA